MIILSVDVGLARTGLAVCDKGELLASPLETICETDLSRLADKVADIAKAHFAETVVVGHPVNMDGSHGESALRAEAFSHDVQEKAGIPVVLWDERLTTVSAAAYLNQTNVRGKKRKAIIDTVSAVIILENYLENRRLTGHADR